MDDNQIFRNTDFTCRWRFRHVIFDASEFPMHSGKALSSFPVSLRVVEWSDGLHVSPTIVGYLEHSREIMEASNTLQKGYFVKS
ncbi:hypothetical protein Ccrd_008366 [Cynara cardunculus var. scolymus]|uniref:Uncharacterized protein n=1 Tax=Cynara cardunculus var. scolymus TaxID=59895 RepID=A0A103XF87_CYNCS|nr:hypothetical protein Ccrd_008366 [Cynara cardunculus var. scolymus]